MTNMRRKLNHMKEQGVFKRKDNSDLVKRTFIAINSMKKVQNLYEKANKRMDEVEYEGKKLIKDSVLLNYEDEISIEGDSTVYEKFKKEKATKLAQVNENHKEVEGDYYEDELDKEPISNERIDDDYERSLNQDYENGNTSEEYLEKDSDDKTFNRKINNDQKLKDAPKMLFDMLSPSGTLTDHRSDVKRYNKKSKIDQKHKHAPKKLYNVFPSSDFSTEQSFYPTITKSYATSTTTMTAPITTNSTISFENEIQAGVVNYFWLFIFVFVFTIFISCFVGALCAFCGCCGDLISRRKNAERSKIDRSRTLLY